MSDPCLKLVNELPVSERNKHYWKIKLCEKDLKMINTTLIICVVIVVLIPRH